MFALRFDITNLRVISNWALIYGKFFSFLVYLAQKGINMKLIILMNYAFSKFEMKIRKIGNEYSRGPGLVILYV